MHSASFETTYSSYTRMEIQKTYHSIAVTPINISEVVAGEILYGTFGLPLIAVGATLYYLDLRGSGAGA